MPEVYLWRIRQLTEGETDAHLDVWEVRSEVTATYENNPKYETTIVSVEVPDDA